MSTILVTGGAGFIGSWFVRQQLRRGGVRIVNLDKLTYAGNVASLDSATTDPHHVFVQGDIADRPLVDELLETYNPSAVVHLAAESHVDRSIEGPAEFVQTNVVGTVMLLESVCSYLGRKSASRREAFRFLHVSTDEVYGSLGAEGSFRETTPYAPNSPYSASKAAADHFVRAYHHTHGLPAVITNCSNNYGPCQFPEKLIPVMVLKAAAGEPLPVYGSGKNIRDWLYVEDHCHALREVLDRGRVGECYNIGGNCERTNLEVVQEICRIVDELAPPAKGVSCADLIEHVADRPGHDLRYAIDSTKIHTELGWRPKTTFQRGLRRTVAWYLTNPSWIETVRGDAGIGERRGLRAA
jgi:dTDP-glucose 4,6-dehydratase